MPDDDNVEGVVIQKNGNSIAMPITVAVSVILGISSWGFQLYNKNSALVVEAVKEDVVENTEDIESNTSDIDKVNDELDRLEQKVNGVDNQVGITVTNTNNVINTLQEIKTDIRSLRDSISRMEREGVGDLMERMRRNWNNPPE